MISMRGPILTVPHLQGMPLGYPPQGTPGAWPQGQPQGLPPQGFVRNYAITAVDPLAGLVGLPGQGSLVGLPPAGASPNNQFHPQPHVGGIF